MDLLPAVMRHCRAPRWKARRALSALGTLSVRLVAGLLAENIAAMTRDRDYRGA